MLLKPDETEFQALCAFAESFRSFDGGDQGLLNKYFDQWSVSGPESRLPFTHNMTANARYGCPLRDERGTTLSFPLPVKGATIREHCCMPTIDLLYSGRTCSYGYLPAYVEFGSDVLVAHFAGIRKPWEGMPHPASGQFPCSA